MELHWLKPLLGRPAPFVTIHLDATRADASGDEEAVSLTGVSIALLGTADAETSRRWFDGLSVGATVVDPLQKRPWGASDGIILDRYGLRWLIGFED